MKTQLIIKGAIYTNGDTLLRAHFSGIFHMVDCTEYKTKKEIKANYSKEHTREFLKGTTLEYEGVKYYECEFSPYNVDDDFILLSDLSTLKFFEEETNF